MKNILKLFLLGTIIYFSFANTTFAQIIFTELMHDPEGTDTGREWIEIKNIGTETINFTTYKLFENNVNHKISTYQGGDMIPAGQFAVIADNPEKFLIDFPIFSGLLFDSAFSLSNTGETIEIRNQAGVLTDTLTYNSDMGAKNTGNSLQFYNSNWFPAIPTPGAENMTESVDEFADSEKESDANTASNSTSGNLTTTTVNKIYKNSTHSNQSPVVIYKNKITLEISGGRDRYVTLNSPVIFDLLHNQDFLKGAKINWSMGDGSMKRGKKIEHTYLHAGEHNVVINVSDSDAHAVSRLKVLVVKPNLKVILHNENSKKGIEIKNESSSEINLGGFYIELNNSHIFVMPADTIISAKNSLFIDYRILNINENITQYLLRYPNNDIYF